MAQQASRIDVSPFSLSMHQETRAEDSVSTLDLANPALQLISTRNSQSNFEYIKQLFGYESALRLFDGILENPEYQLYRCYRGKPLDLQFFLSSDYWYCNQINLRIFENAAAIGVNLEHMGYHTVQRSLQRRQQTILGLVHLLGIEKIFSQAQRVNALYNRTKQVVLQKVTADGVSGELIYHRGISHSPLVTRYNIGCYRGVLEYLGYQNVRVDVIEDRVAFDEQQGVTRLAFSWTPMQLKHRIAMLLGSIACNSLFSRYLTSAQCLKRYHQPLIDDYQYHQQRTSTLIAEIEQRYLERLSVKQLEIEQLSNVVSEQQEALTQLQNSFAKRVDEWLQQNACRSGISAADFAADLYMSERNLNRKLGENLGAPAKTLINQFKLAKAKQLLESGASISDIADECGYSSQSYFAQAFKRQFGKTPSEWARS